MPRFSMVAATLVTLALFAFPASSTAGGDLARPFTITFGHVFAMTLEREIATVARVTDWDAPITVDYDGTGDHLDVELLGARSETEHARASLDRFRHDILPVALDRANTRSGTDVAKEQVTVSYRNRRTWVSIIRWRDGKYEVPR